MLHALPHPTPSLRLFAWMCDCVRAAIAPHARTDTPAGAVLVYLTSYLGRAVTRLDRLFTRWRAGKLRPARLRAPRSRIAAPNRPRLPRADMWLIKRVQQTAIAQGQLQLLLQDAEIQDFLRQVPAAGRILRPLCTAVGLALPETLRRPPRTRKPRPPPPEPPRHGKYKRFSLRRYRPGKPTIAFPKPP